MKTTDIQVMREFVAKAPLWFAELKDDFKSKECVMCGVKPKRMVQLSEAVGAFLEAYDEKLKAK